MEIPNGGPSKKRPARRCCLWINRRGGLSELVENGVGEGTQKLFRSGYIAIAGRPNTGKSTFLNRVLGHKVAIVTPKAQTTRTRILGVYEQGEVQMVFLDTPGIHNPGRVLLNQAMVQTAYDSCRDADVTLYFVEAGTGLTDEDRQILATPSLKDSAVILVFNKMDRTPRDRLMMRLAAVAPLVGEAFAEVVPISALTGRNMERLLDLLPQFLPEGPRYFPTGQKTDQPDTFIIGEVIREKLFLQLQQELPYALAVRVVTWQKRSPPSLVWDLDAEILVVRESQKGIVIGHQGSVLKRVGSMARRELEAMFGGSIFMRLQVHVQKDWNGDPRVLMDLGYTEPVGDAD
ncbi:MAG: GTPase Era [Magnetococcales bacterium]|nr:GTPase Era [Magnetococcales bacterium]